LYFSTNKKNTDKSIKNYKLFIRKNNLSYEALFNLALVYYKTKQYENAIIYAKKAANVARSKRQAKAFYTIGLAYIKLKKPKTALKYLGKSINSQPSYLKPRKMRANLNFDSKRKLAVAELKNIIKFDPKYTRGFFLLASHHFESGAFAEASQVLKLGISSSQRSNKLRSLLGRTYLASEDYDNARKTYEKLIEDFSPKVRYHFNLGRALSKLELFLPAIDQYKLALAIDPRYFKAIFNIGTLYQKLGDFPQAINYFKKSLKINPDKSSVFYNLGLISSKLNHTDEAIKHFEKALEIDPKNKKSMFNLARIYDLKSQDELAIKKYKQTIKIDPAYISPYLNLSKILVAKKDIGGAVDLLKKGLSMTSGTKLRNRLAYYLFLERKYSSSLQIYQAVLRSDPNNKLALLGSGRIFFATSRFKECKGVIERYVFLRPTVEEGRYYFMACLYNLSEFKESSRQLSIVERLHPGKYFDVSGFREKLTSMGFMSNL